MAGDNVIRIMCPNLSCKRVLAVPAHARGKLVRCKACSMVVRIPMPKQPIEAQSPAPTQAPPSQQDSPEAA